MRFAEEGGEEQIRRHRGIRGEVGREEPLGATGPLVVELQSEGWMQDCGGDDRAVDADGFVTEQMHQDRSGCRPQISRLLLRVVEVGMLSQNRRSHEARAVAEHSVEGSLRDVSLRGDTIERQRLEPFTGEEGDHDVDHAFIPSERFGCGGPTTFSRHRVTLAIMLRNRFIKGVIVTDLIHHIAIQDDWEMSRAFGEYSVATRGVHVDDAGFIHAATADGLDAVIAARYSDLALPLLDIAISPEALAAEGIVVEWVDGRPRILGALPMTSDVVASETLIAR